MTMQKENNERQQKHTDDMNKENQRLNDSYNTSDNEKVREVKHKPHCRIAIFGEACECGKESKGWKEEFKEKHEIATWMRNQGIGDNDNFSAEELQEVLENYFDDKVTALLSQKDTEMAEKIEKIRQMKKENCKWKGENGICQLCIEEEYCNHEIENQTLDKVLSILKPTNE